MVPSNEYEWRTRGWEPRGAGPDGVPRPPDAYQSYEDSYHVPHPPPPEQQQWAPSYHPAHAYQYPPHLQGRQPMSAYHQQPHEPSRRLGQWTREEEAYAEKVAALFKTGRVPNCPEGLTMRALLADLLNCAPMRVSKKFSGERAIGKCSYKRVQDDLSKEEEDLKPLEEAFHRSLRGVGHLKMSLAHTSNLMTPVEAARNPHRLDVNPNQLDQKPTMPAQMMGYHPAYMQDPRNYAHYARSPQGPPRISGPPMMGRPPDGSGWPPPGNPSGGGYPGGNPHMMGPPPPNGYMTHSSQMQQQGYPGSVRGPPGPPPQGAGGGPPSAQDDLSSAAAASQGGHPSLSHGPPPTHEPPYQSHDGMRPAKMQRYAHHGGPGAGAGPPMSPRQQPPMQHHHHHQQQQQPPTGYAPSQMQQQPNEQHWASASGGGGANNGYPDDRPEGQTSEGAVSYE